MYKLAQRRRERRAVRLLVRRPLSQGYVPYLRRCFVPVRNFQYLRIGRLFSSSYYALRTLCAVDQVSQMPLRYTRSILSRLRAILMYDPSFSLAHSPAYTLTSAETTAEGLSSEDAPRILHHDPTYLMFGQSLRYALDLTDSSNSWYTVLALTF